MKSSEFRINQRAFARVRRSGAYGAVVRDWPKTTIVACSGGTDSAALLAIASIARDAGRIPAFVVAHVDHHTRLETADEGRFVARLASAVQVPFVQLVIGAAGSSRSSGLEAELRAGRYMAIARLAKRLGIASVTTAHTHDDQIETILLRLFSGSGAQALSGMREHHVLETGEGPIEVSRPLLDIRRSELEDILQLLELPHIEDPSNDDVRYRRNRLRHRIIPELEAFDPGFGAGLVRAVSLAEADARIVDRIATVLYRDRVVERPGIRRIPRDLFNETDQAISSRIVRQAALSLVSGDSRELTQERILAIVSTATGRSGAVIELPYGIIATVGRDEILVAIREDTKVEDGNDWVS